MINKLLKKFSDNKILMWNPNTNYLVYINHFKKIMDYCIENKDFRLNYQTWLNILNSDNPGSKIGSETHNVCQALNIIDSEYLYRVDKEPSEIKIRIPRELLYQYVIDDKNILDEFYNIIAKRYFELLNKNNIFEMENLEHFQRVALNLFVCYLKDTNKMCDEEIANYINFAKSSSNDVINKINKVYSYDICKESANLLEKLKITLNHNESSNTKVFLESLFHSLIDEIENNVNDLRDFYIKNTKNNDDVETMIKQREKFVYEYPLSRLLTLTLEEYCLGFEGNKDSFCYKLEKGEYATTGFGIGGANASKFGVYLKKDGKFHGKNDNIIDNPNLYWQEFKQQLYDFIVEMGIKEPTFNIDEKYPLLGGSGGYMYLTKLLNLYYPDRFISMSKEEAYKKLNTYLNIPNRANAVINSYYGNIAFRKYAPESNEHFGYYISNAIWKFFKMDDKDEMMGDDTMLIEESSRLSGAYSKIYYGIPGCGKSWIANDFALKCSKDDNLIVRTTFYPDYTNGDFVGQIIPKIGDNNSVLYDIQSGPFIEAMVKAIDNPNQYVCLIVEEINRGNAAAIFGDLFQLLDRKEDGTSTYWIKNYIITEYLKEHCLNKSYDVEHIRIPSNLYIIGTMNTCDQNVFTLDTAFKRRWKMEYIQNNIDDCKYANEIIPLSNVTWSEFVKEINNFITGEFGLDINGEDKQIGSYFISSAEWNDIKTTSDPKEAARIFAEKILSYIWDDVAKINRESWFDRNKYRTLDSLVKGFTEKGLEVFGDNISFTRDENNNGKE